MTTTSIEVEMYGCIANVGHIQCMCHWCGQYATYYDTKEEDIWSYRYNDTQPTEEDLTEYSTDTMNCAMCIVCRLEDAYKILELCHEDDQIADIQTDNGSWCIMYIKTNLIVPDVCIKYLPPIYNVEFRPKDELDMGHAIDQCTFEHFTARVSLMTDSLQIEKKNTRFVPWEQIANIE